MSISTHCKGELPSDEMLLTSVAAIRTDFSVCAFMAIEMFLLMTHARTKSTFLLHREFEPQRHLGWGEEQQTAGEKGKGEVGVV